MGIYELLYANAISTVGYMCILSL